MPARELLGAEATVLGTSTQTIAANATTPFVFSPVLYVPALTGYTQGDRLVAVFTAVRAAGSTSTLTVLVQDADDNAGAFGTPATAVTDGTSLTAAAGSQQKVIGIRLQNGRPWLRFSAVHAGGGTDSYACTLVLLGLGSGI